MMMTTRARSTPENVRTSQYHNEIQALRHLIWDAVVGAAALRPRQHLSQHCSTTITTTTGFITRPIPGQPAIIMAVGQAC
jgi:hypothetical protein